jgi:hypothetical protein
MGGASMPLMVLLARGVERFDILFQLGGMEEYCRDKSAIAFKRSLQKSRTGIWDNF